MNSQAEMEAAVAAAMARGDDLHIDFTKHTSTILRDIADRIDSSVELVIRSSMLLQQNSDGLVTYTIVTKYA